MKGMSREPVEFYVSTQGWEQPEVVARFTHDERGLHVERFDRLAGRWVLDSTVFGFSVGLDDWAEPASQEQAARIIAGWGFDPALVDAPVTATATT